MRRIPASSLAVSVGLVAASAAAASSYAYDPAPHLLTNPKEAAAGEYQLEIAHSSVTMKLSHMGLSFYTLRFNELRGHYDFDPLHPTASRVAVSINPNSIDTGNQAFNGIIAKQYFETAKFPEITFTSTAITGNSRTGTVVGILDMHGVRKPIALHVTYHGFDGAEKPERMGFSATASLRRSDFGVDPYVPAEGDQVIIQIETEFRRNAAV